MSIDDPGIDELPSGRFRARVQHGPGSVSRTFATRTEAVDFRNAVLREIADGHFTPVRGLTLKKIGPTFLASRSGNRDAASDAGRWHRHVASALFADKALAAVTYVDGLDWLEALREKMQAYDPAKHGKRPPKKLSWQTRKHCVNLARRAFAWALGKQLYTGVNPFNDLKVEREDGDEDEGFQESWYLDAAEQARLFKIWDALDGEGDRAEASIGRVAIGTGLRLQELWSLHLGDVHMEDEGAPYLHVRFGSWDPIKERYRPPKGRRGERRPRRVPLFGLALDAIRTWLAQLAWYAPKNPLGLVFPTERGKRRDKKPPRSWPKVLKTFGDVPGIGRKPWWHLLRHTCASSLVSGAWGFRWSLEDVSKMLGHSSIKTTEIYAHFAPSAVQRTATQSQELWDARCHERCHDADFVDELISEIPEQYQLRATEDSNLRPTAPETARNTYNLRANLAA